MSGHGRRTRGLQHGDVLVSVNGKPIRSLSKLHEVIRGKQRQARWSWLRARRQAAHRAGEARVLHSGWTGRWMIGVQLERPIIITQLGFGAALSESVEQNIKSATLIYQFLQGIIERRMSAKSIEGPIGIARLSGDAAREGPTAFLD